MDCLLSSRPSWAALVSLPALASILLLACTTQTSNREAESAIPPTRRRPNVLIVVADDMGYADIGALGGEIKTPNLDRLAAAGTLFTRFYTAPTCSPTRAMLLTGVDNHLAGLGNMEETLDPSQIGQPGYEGYLNRDVASVAEIFGEAGYQTYMTGKWHLGTEHDQSPHARGFQRTFSLLGGGASHFADRVGQDVYRRVAYYRADGELIDRLPEGYYSSNHFAETMIRFIEEGDPDRPFLGYLAFTAPHWPLQAPPESLQGQRGNYSAGYDLIRARRFQALKEAGLVPEEAAQPRGTAPPWESLTPEARARSERLMETYAAMVENMDANIGRVLGALEDSGQLDNTVIVFMSDNGADGLEFEAVAPAFAEWTRSFDNSLDNIGQPGSFVSYGRGWAHTGEAPHRGFKGLMTEGGTRSPMLMVLPKSLAERRRARAARYSHAVTVRDVLPTLLDLAGVSTRGRGEPKNERPPLSGKSLRAALSEPQTAVHSGEALVAELWDCQTVILDDWKLVRHSAPRGDGTWKLYDLARDLGETTDLSAQRPALVARLQAEYRAYARANRVVKPSAPFGLVKPANPTPKR